jgi:hypothetical protein
MRALLAPDQGQRLAWSRAPREGTAPGGAGHAACRLAHPGDDRLGRPGQHRPGGGHPLLPRPVRLGALRHPHARRPGDLPVLPPGGPRRGRRRAHVARDARPGDPQPLERLGGRRRRRGHHQGGRGRRAGPAGAHHPRPLGPPGPGRRPGRGRRRGLAGRRAPGRRGGPRAGGDDLVGGEHPGLRGLPALLRRGVRLGGRAPGRPRHQLRELEAGRPHGRGHARDDPGVGRDPGPLDDLLRRPRHRRRRPAGRRPRRLGRRPALRHHLRTHRRPRRPLRGRCSVVTPTG